MVNAPTQETPQQEMSSSTTEKDLRKEAEKKTDGVASIFTLADEMALPGSLGEDVQKYIDTVISTLNGDAANTSGENPYVFQQISVRGQELLVCGNANYPDNGIALLFERSQTNPTVSLTEGIPKINEHLRSRQGAIIRVKDSLVVTDEALERPGTMARYLKATLYSQYESVRKITPQAFNDIDLTLDSDRTSAIQWLKAMYPTLPMPRADLAFTINMTKRAHNRGEAPESQPIAVVTGYVDWVQVDHQGGPAGLSQGVMFAPLVHITGVFSHIQNPLVVAVAYPTAAYLWTKTGQWFAPFDPAKKDAIDLAPLRTKDGFTPEPFQDLGDLSEFLTNKVLPPTLCMDVMEGSPIMTGTKMLSVCPADLRHDGERRFGENGQRTIGLSESEHRRYIETMLGQLDQVFTPPKEKGKTLKYADLYTRMFSGNGSFVQPIMGGMMQSGSRGWIDIRNGDYINFVNAKQSGKDVAELLTLGVRNDPMKMKEVFDRIGVPVKFTTHGRTTVLNPEMVEVFNYFVQHGQLRVVQTGETRFVSGFEQMLLTNTQAQSFYGMEGIQSSMRGPGWGGNNHGLML